MHPLNTVKGAITTGVVLAVIIGIGLACWMSNTAGFHAASFDRWLHILSGVMWIGLLYYFNVVQTPGLAVAAADKGGPGGAAISKYIAPRALAWFRWAALLTWFTGIWYLGRAGNFMNAVTLGTYGGAHDHYGLTIGIGGWLGTIMALNV